MSRDSSEQRGAWEAWLTFHTIDGQVPVAYAHGPGCSGIDWVPTALHDVPIAVCPSCHFEVEYPERDASPLYSKEAAK